MSQNAQHFKIGLFVIAAAVLLATSVTLLGASTVLKEKVYGEIYLDETVEGLQVGSPIKFRGVKVGEIEEIDFAMHAYRDKMTEELQAQYGRLVVITVAITAPRWVALPEAEREHCITRDCEQGMRVRLATTGITGVAYLEIDFLDPERNPIQSYPWAPENPVIPSAESAVGRIMHSAEEVFDQLGSADLEGTIENLNGFLADLRTTLEAARLPDLTNELIGVSGDLRTLVKELDVGTMMADVSAIAHSGKQIAGELETEMPGLVDGGGDAVTRFESTLKGIEDLLTGPEVNGLVEGLSGVTGTLVSSTASLPGTMSHLDRVVRRADRLLSLPVQDVQDILASLRVIANNLRDVSEEARVYPSHLLFGEPPTPANGANR